MSIMEILEEEMIVDQYSEDDTHFQCHIDSLVSFFVKLNYEDMTAEITRNSIHEIQNLNDDFSNNDLIYNTLINNGFKIIKNEMLVTVNYSNDEIKLVRKSDHNIIMELNHNIYLYYYIDTKKCEIYEDAYHYKGEHVIDNKIIEDIMKINNTL